MSEREKLVEIVARASETVILRRFHANKIEGYTLKMAQEIAAASLAAVEESGWVCVPREPTARMIECGHLADPLACDVPDEQIAYVYGEMYRAMVEAA
jgi:hypothetical protein